MTKAISNEVRSGAVVALALVPLAVAEINSALWTLVAGVVTSLLAERGEPRSLAGP